MKMRLRNLAAAAILAASFSGTASAAEEWASSNVKFVYPLSNGGFVIGLVDSPAGCTNANNPKYLYVAVGSNGVTQDGAKMLLSVALTGFAAGKRLSVNFENSTPNCYVNRLLVTD
jgi:hypothetical protein